MKTVVLSGVLVVGSILPALAQGGTLSDSDKAFLAKDSRGATYELKSAALAATKAKRQDVKSYAQKLVHDHQTYNAALQKLGTDEGITLPTEPDAADKAKMAELEALNGEAFDTLYIQEALRINSEDKMDADKEKAATKSATVKAFIAKFADMDAEHERLARTLAASKD